MTQPNFKMQEALAILDEINVLLDQVSENKQGRYVFGFSDLERRFYELTGIHVDSCPINFALHYEKCREWLIYARVRLRKMSSVASQQATLHSQQPVLS